jgi:hypothetical protein
MIYNFFKPKPGRFGVAPVLLNSGQIGGTNFLGGASPLTANGTTTFRLGGTAGRKCMVSRFGATVVTVPVDADGAITAVLQKYDASADAVVVLTGPINLETLVTREETSVPFLASLTAAQATFDVGDALEVAVVNDSAAIDTQPAGLVFTVELLVQE